jgi:hypothetical protein
MLTGLRLAPFWSLSILMWITTDLILSQRQSYFTTGGLPPISSSCRQAPWDSRQTNFIFQLNTCGYSPLWREAGSVIYNCFWASPAQSFSRQSPAGLKTIFYCPRFETPPTWRARSPYLYPPRKGWPSYTSSHWDPFSSPPTTRRATVEVFDPASTRVWLNSDLNGLSYVGVLISLWLFLFSYLQHN